MHGDWQQQASALGIRRGSKVERFAESERRTEIGSNKPLLSAQEGEANESYLQSCAYLPWLCVLGSTLSSIIFESTEGKVEIFKEKITVDEANKSVTLVALEGHVMEEFKSYKIVFGVTPMSDQSSVVKITLDYEKLNENIPDPNKYLQFLMNVIKDIDAHLLKA
ncbi:Polyketide cyclase/dehydrase and lipid transport superfamily protein, putative [Theobroma cacao]|uniref:Polyketide cyclase/dehydrase and lipid transport superfamily protein, putative n=1 Tax=Theobroma cacao TaxID=3641 RepID=A0A061E8L4_THECC|nr:Polyketide cyclase/dehydrase and lipid transport superfamily protein, putative [Theobroma cacao]